MDPTPAPSREVLASSSAWANAAADLAARVTGRARLGAALSAAAPPVGIAAVLAIVARVAARFVAPSSAQAASVVVPGLLAAGLVVAVVRGGRAARRARATRLADAAWALDRLCGARGAGIAAALARPEVAAAAEAIAPRPARFALEAPPGLASLVAGLLLAAGALLVPARDRRDGSAPAEAASADARTGLAARSAAALEAAATTEAAQAQRRRAVREALGLPSEGPLHREDLARALASPQAREAAREAAHPEAAAALARDGEAGVDALAAVLSGEPGARAEALRREALARRAAAPGVPVPPGRRAVVARYLAARLGSPLQAPSPPATSDPAASPDRPEPGR